jgi:DNA sulfur modification protein DndB
MTRSAVLKNELFNQPMQEVEEMIKRKNDLSVNQFATISGIKGTQFNKEIFASILKFKDLMEFLEVFPNVQRNIVKRKVSKIKNYVLSGIENPNLMRFFPAITVTARGHIFYDESTTRLAIDTLTSKLSVNDGQHRFYGISEAISEIENRIQKAKDYDTKTKYKAYLNQLENMVIPMTIFNNLTEEEEKQLFYDINNLSQRPSRSANIRLVQNDNIAKMAREIAEENKYFKYYGVEYNKMSIHSNNPNTILLTTIYAMIKNLYWTEYMNDFNFITKDNYDKYKKETNDIITEIFFALPPDLQVKDKYILGKNYALKGITKFIHEVRMNKQLDYPKAFETLSKIDWTMNLDVWRKYGAFPSTKTGKMQFSGNGEGGINGVYTACIDKYSKL